MKILIIGGTVFLGRHIALAALAAGDSVTLFHRGHHALPSELQHPNLEEVLGDRETELSKLQGRTWDTIIDTSAYRPESVERVASQLANAASTYALISTISVYSDLSKEGITEDSALATLADPAERAVTNETYGALKVLCEHAARAGFGQHALIVRPGLIVGPNDPTGRFTYWPRRIREAGQVLVPGSTEAPVQFIDVRDLASFVLTLVRHGVHDTVHVTGPKEPLTMQQFVESCAAISGSTPTFVWVGEEALGDRLGEMQIPMWLPKEYWNLNKMDISRALSLGLTISPLERTIRDTLVWADRDKGTSEPMARGYLTRERESDLVKEFMQPSAV